MSIEDILNKPADLAGTLGDIPPTLKDLFDRDPLSLAESDIAVIVKQLRAERLSFLKEERTAKTAGRKPNYKKAAKDINVEEIDI